MVTLKELAQSLSTEPRLLRHYLRRAFPRPAGGRWEWESTDPTLTTIMQSYRSSPSEPRGPRAPKTAQMPVPEEPLLCSQCQGPRLELLRLVGDDPRGMRALYVCQDCGQRLERLVVK